MEHFSMSSKQIEKVIAQFPAKMVVRSDTTCTVQGKRKLDGETIVLLSAVRGAGGWHVMAVPGLITRA